MPETPKFAHLTLPPLADEDEDATRVPDPATDADDSDEDAPKSFGVWTKELNDNVAVDDYDVSGDIAVLTKNMQRCDVRVAARTTLVKEGSGNPRWQCERAAKFARDKGRLSLANFLDQWADKHKKAQCVSDTRIWESTAVEIEAAVKVLLYEYGEVDDVVVERLVHQKIHQTHLNGKDRQFKQMLATSFPWKLSWTQPGDEFNNLQPECCQTSHRNERSSTNTC